MSRPPLSPEAIEVAQRLAKSGGSLRPAGITERWWCVWCGDRQVGGFIPRAVARELIDGDRLTEKRKTLKKGVVK